MANFFGGKDPFDHPFFTHPFGDLFGGKSPFDDPFFGSTFDNRPGNRKQITIEELNPNDDDGYDAWQKSVPSKELSVKSPNEYSTAPGSHSFSFQRVAFGGPDGVYYTSSVGRRTRGDGVFLMEMKEEDKTVGQSLHTISKGIHDKGHSVTTKQCADGRVDSLQTLHNLNEDELMGFEESWKINADKVLPEWSNGLLENSGANNRSAWDDFPSWSGWGGWPLPSFQYFDNGRALPENESQATSSRGTSRKIVPIE